MSLDQQTQEQTQKLQNDQNQEEKPQQQGKDKLVTEEGQQDNTSFNGIQTEQRHGHSSSMDKSVWIAKKQRMETEKYIDLISNRLQTLKKEEDRMIKKIYDTQTKTKNILNGKKRNCEINQKKSNNRQNDDEFLYVMQKKSYEIRKKQEEERSAIRQALLELKTEEANEIKRQKKVNEKKIKAIKQNIYDEKKTKYQKIQDYQNQSKKNIEMYWSQRIQFFEQEQEKERMYNLNTKSQKDIELETLEKAEMDLIKRLQFSQQIHQDACKELDTVLHMSPNDYLKMSLSLDKKQTEENDNVSKTIRNENLLQQGLGQIIQNEINKSNETQQPVQVQ